MMGLFPGRFRTLQHCAGVDHKDHTIDSLGELHLIVLLHWYTGEEAIRQKERDINSGGGEISGREPNRAITGTLPFWLANSTFYSFPCLQQTGSLVWIDRDGYPNGERPANRACLSPERQVSPGVFFLRGNDGAYDSVGWM